MLIGTTAQVDNDTFIGNTVVVDASSNGTTLTVDPVSCFYNPMITAATGNTFDGSGTPRVTPSDYGSITGDNLASSFDVPSVQEYPSGWVDDIHGGSGKGTISVKYEPCIDVTDPSSPYVAIAIPLNLSGAPISPVAGDDNQKGHAVTIKERQR